MTKYNKNKSDYDSVLNEGLTAVNLKQYDKGKVYFQELIKINKERYEGYLNLSNIIILEGNDLEALELLKKYINEIGLNQDIINAIAINLFNSKNFAELSKHVDLYIEEFDNHLLNYLKGSCLNNINEMTKSEFFLKKSININNSFWPSYEMLFYAYESRSKLIEMNSLLNESKKIFADNLRLLYFEALYNFRTNNYKVSNEILKNKKVENFFKKQNKSLLAEFLNLKSKVSEKVSDYKSCLQFALERNVTLINLEINKKFNKREVLDTINTYTNFFNINSKPLNFDTKNGINHSNLTFLVGFPRSGTTLLDTILRTHSRTLVVEERPYLLNIRHEFFKNNNLFDLLSIDEINKIKLQEKYLKKINYDSNKIIIDKFPLNLIELGFIKTIFPSSKIILAIRHPLDCVLSCVLTAFTINDAMINFENLKTSANFYDKVFNLFNKYLLFFNFDFHQVKYENVVLDFENQIKNLLTYLNLEFEKSVISFYDTAKKREKIHTPSYDQVIKPIYSNSVNRHLNFKDIKDIEPTVNKWINYYGY